MVILAPENIYCKLKVVIRDEEECYILIKGSNHQEDITILNLHMWRWSSYEEIYHNQGQKAPSKMVGTGVAVRKYPMPKGKGEAPARW